MSGFDIFFPETKEDVGRSRENLEKRSDERSLQSLKDASMHLGTRSVQVGLATIGPVAPVRCIAQSPRAAVHGCSRVIMQVLPRPVVSGFNPRPQTDVECRLSPVLIPGALASGRTMHAHLISPASPPRAGQPVISHRMYDFRRETKRETSRLAPSHSSVPRFLASTHSLTH